MLRVFPQEMQLAHYPFRETNKGTSTHAKHCTAVEGVGSKNVFYPAIKDTVHLFSSVHVQVHAHISIYFWLVWCWLLNCGRNAKGQWV